MKLLPALFVPNRLRSASEDFIMTRLRLLPALVWCLGAFITGSAAAQQCNHDGGTWLDNFGYGWYLLNNAGVVYVDCDTGYGPYPWNVSGSMSSDGNFILTATNPYFGQYGFENCVQSFTYDGHVYAGGCDSADGTWSNSVGGGSFGMTKSCDVPTGETTSSTAWGWSSRTDGVVDNAGPYYVYAVTVNNGTYGVLSGRYAQEGDYSPAHDGCYYSGSPIPEQTGVTAPGPFVLDSSNAYVDTLGWSADAITTYRAHGNLPCSLTLYQKMEIACGVYGSLPPWSTFKMNTLVLEITDMTHITETRDGHSHSRVYP